MYLTFHKEIKKEIAEESFDSIKLAIYQNRTIRSRSSLKIGGKYIT